ncbi:hypothetical protein CHGG_05748 [Chaetomium globosum CBS 148.51]|uniref:C2H2-type domain-containing protein n=1 Tax=Chaetomium globosum (strain ATCC 6205 / CBS 148.51 / DSM 1962 / NBRC 6347 / NRRL 1970) TaxID=306901 RepID=Q2H6G7_CHAGB|nr:uncharacterized protein CHGG_05748 [Chaetomium globosum CBS 148.51]EAQ89129.1 hypothetical protein CHGG_05748 [Chaetomium globosum CBS 148.51]
MKEESTWRSTSRARTPHEKNLSFRKHQTLQRHVRVAHLGTAAFVCTAAEDCEAGFDTAGALRRHVEREHGELRFWCEECAAGGGDEEEGDGRKVGFRTLLMLQTHMRKEHVDCVFCDVKCGSQADLERHVDMYHSGTTVEDRKTVECPWDGCGKKFTRVPNLNTHIRSAHEGFRFVCGQVDTYQVEDIADWNWQEEGCGQAFISKMKMEEHVRYVHLGRKRPPKLYTVKSALPGDEDEMSAALPTRTIPCSVEECETMFIRACRPGQASAEASPQTARRMPSTRACRRAAGNDEPFWVESVIPAVAEPSFDAEWTEMRRLIDLDALVDAKE